MFSFSSSLREDRTEQATEKSKNQNDPTENRNNVTEDLNRTKENPKTEEQNAEAKLQERQLGEKNDSAKSEQRKILIEASHLTKIFRMGSSELRALDDLSLEIESGEFLAVTGSSGSGKSTLMHIIGCLDSPTSGYVKIDGERIDKASSDQLAKIRNQKIGFVFQKFNLLQNLTALDNVALPMLYAGLSERRARKEAAKILDAVELGHRKKHYPNQLSGGQQQRVAIARAMINKPKIILADEPTGNLDSKTGKVVMEIFNRLNKEFGVTIMLVTHEPDVAEQADRQIKLLDGKIIADSGKK
jgi:putative ABC transport system ATP-binding protein